MIREVDTPAQVAMYGGSASAITVWGLQLSELAAIISALVAVIGLIVHIWATMRKDRRAEEAHRLEMEGLRNGATHLSAGGAEENRKTSGEARR